uniref:Uncharacterized protein n=1 Tax=Chlamydomonas leiostraca TaxID=1034604 RepID=A0A7S0WHX7_9CHLO
MAGASTSSAAGPSITLPDTSSAAAPPTSDGAAAPPDDAVRARARASAQLLVASIQAAANAAAKAAAGTSSEADAADASGTAFQRTREPAWSSLSSLWPGANASASNWARWATGPGWAGLNANRPSGAAASGADQAAGSAQAARASTSAAAGASTSGAADAAAPEGGAVGASTSAAISPPAAAGADDLIYAFFTAAVSRAQGSNADPGTTNCWEQDVEQERQRLMAGLQPPPGYPGDLTYLASLADSAPSLESVSGQGSSEGSSSSSSSGIRKGRWRWTLTGQCWAVTGSRGACCSHAQCQAPVWGSRW